MTDKEIKELQVNTNDMCNTIDNIAARLEKIETILETPQKEEIKERYTYKGTDRTRFELLERGVAVFVQFYDSGKLVKELKIKMIGAIEHKKI